MSKKFTLEECQEIFSQVGLTILENEAKGIDYKYKCVDKNGYLYSRSTHSIQACLKRKTTGFSHIFSTKNPYFYENMLHYIEKEVKTGTILLTPKNKIKNIDQYLVFKCGICGEEYKTTWHIFIRNTDKICNFCFNRKRAVGETNTKHQDTNKFHLKAQELGICILTGPQIRWHDKIIVQDKKGYRGLMSPATIMHSSSFDRFGVANPFTLDNLRLYAFKKGWDCVIYDQEYKGDKKPFKVMCSCGNDFEVDTTHFIAGKFQCNECRVKQSYISKKVEEWLIKNNIQYQKEKSYPDCKNINPLPFDYHLKDYNALIEVDGMGHYRPVPFGGDKEEGIKQYKERIYNDEIKTKYCETNNIPLLRLPFWIIEKDEHEEALKEFIENLSIRSNDSNI